MSSSPFQKKKVEFRREPTTYESMRDAFAEKLNGFFLAYLPSDDIKAMSPEYLYPIGIIAILCLFGIFLAVFLNGYYSSINTQYLSPISGTVADKRCVTVPTVSTGTYLATQSGQWQGADNFQFGKASYQLSLISTSFTYPQYAGLMQRVYVSLQFIKNISVNYDLASNIMYWMSKAFVPEIGNTAQRLVFVGTPLVVLNRQKVVGTVSNVFGDCNASSTASFDSSNGILSLVYDYSEYMANPICNNTLDPSLLNYLPNADEDKFTIEIDTRSIVTAVAVNMGILDSSNLVELTDFRAIYNYQGNNYTVGTFYDPKYNGMDPIQCINLNVSYERVTNYTFCALLLDNKVYGIPVFNHFGTDVNLPSPCNCSTLSDYDKQYSFSACNVFSFITGVLFYPTITPDDIMNMWLHIGVTTINQVITSPINQLAYDAAFIASYWGKNSENRTLFESPSYREQVYSFCDVPGGPGPCSFITFSVFDKNPQNWAVSDYYYQLLTGACQNTFVPSQDQWDLLIEAPFAPLTQDYQKCKYDPSTVMINQAGSSVGNVSILAPLCIAFILLCVYFAQRFGFVSIKKTYTKAEKADALSDLALKLLLARDRDLGADGTIQSIPSKDNTLLAQLVEELSRDPDTLYRVESAKDGGSSPVPVNWDSLKASVGLKKRKNGPGGSGAESVASVASASSAAQALQRAEEGGEPGASDGVELRPIGSPLHHFGEVAEAVVAMRAGRNQFVVLNDYEVTPALIKLCGVERKDTNGSADSSSSGGGGGKDPRDLNVPALFALLDQLIEAFETAAAGGDKSRSVWAQVSQTAVLRVMRVSTMAKVDSRALYYKLNALLSLHAAAVLGVPLEEVKRSHSGKVAYMVGLEPLTLDEIRLRI